MLTAQSSSMSSHNVDMCSFLNRNREFVDIAQCTKIQPADVNEHIPSNIRIGLEDNEDLLDMDNFMARVFSSASMDDEELEAAISVGLEKAGESLLCI